MRILIEIEFQCNIQLRMMINVYLTLGLSDAYFRHQIGTSLVQIMGRCLFGVKPLFEPMVALALSIGSLEHISVKLASKYNNFASAPMR